MPIRLAQINMYPVKSCAGISLQEAQVTARGIHLDREWMVADYGDGTFQTQRLFPRLALVEPSFIGDNLVLQVPGMRPLELPIDRPRLYSRVSATVWGDTNIQSLGCGPYQMQWITEVLGSRRVQLVRMLPSAQRLVHGDTFAQVAFADAYPFLGISRASLDQLNTWLPDGTGPVPMDRFRPNFVFEGCDPFAEDEFTRFRIGDVEFSAGRRCSRCSITTVDQQTGEMHHNEPLRTLNEHRLLPNHKGKLKPMFGMYFVQHGIGTVRVGDKVVLLP